MPKLDTLIEIGFCMGYGDGDFGVSARVAELDRKKFEELLLAIHYATNTAIEMWKREHQPPASEARKP